MISTQKTSEKHPIPVKGSFSVKNTQLMVSSKELVEEDILLAVEESIIHATAPHLLPISSGATGCHICMALLVNAALFVSAVKNLI